MSSQSIGEKTQYREKQNNTSTKKRGYKTDEINITVLFEGGGGTLHLYTSAKKPNVVHRLLLK